MNFKEFSDKERKNVDAYLERFIDNEKNNVKEQFLVYCYELIKEYLKNGKRLRPISFLLSYLSCDGKDAKKVLLPAVAIELYHTYTLILDDLMDEDEFRRNNPTVYKNLKDNFLKKFKEEDYHGSLFNKKSTRFCVALTILIGNLTGTLARLAIHKCDVSEELKLKSLFLIEKLDQWMFYGQSLDIFRENLDINEKEYIELAMYKTGVLFGIPMQIGSLLAGRNEHIQNQFFELGKTMALAFQIQDDILDLTVGKGHEIGSDLRKGKRTLIFLKAYEKNKEIKRYLGKDDVKPAIKIINETGAINYAKNIASSKISESKPILKSLKLSMQYEIMFNDFMKFMIERSY